MNVFSVKIVFLVVVVFWILPDFSGFYVEGCSCYSFHGKLNSRQDGRKNCKDESGDLVSMETKNELEFIQEQLQNETTESGDNEWWIGLEKKNGEWKWLSNQTGIVEHLLPEVNETEAFATIAQNSSNTFVFNVETNETIGKGWICEYKNEKDCNYPQRGFDCEPVSVEVTTVSANTYFTTNIPTTTAKITATTATTTAAATTTTMTTTTTATTTTTTAPPTTTMTTTTATTKPTATTTMMTTTTTATTKPTATTTMMTTTTTATTKPTSTLANQTTTAPKIITSTTNSETSKPNTAKMTVKITAKVTKLTSAASSTATTTAATTERKTFCFDNIIGWLKKNSTPNYVAVALGGLLLATIIGCIVCSWCTRRRKRKEFFTNDAKESPCGNKSWKMIPTSTKEGKNGSQKPDRESVTISLQSTDNKDDKKCNEASTGHVRQVSLDEEEKHQTQANAAGAGDQIRDEGNERDMPSPHIMKVQESLTDTPREKLILIDGINDKKHDESESADGSHHDNSNKPLAEPVYAQVNKSYKKRVVESDYNIVYAELADFDKNISDSSLPRNNQSTAEYAEIARVTKSPRDMCPLDT